MELGINCNLPFTYFWDLIVFQDNPVITRTWTEMYSSHMLTFAGCLFTWLSLPTFSTFSAVSVSTLFSASCANSPEQSFMLLLLTNNSEWRGTRKYLLIHLAHPKMPLQSFQGISVAQNRRNRRKRSVKFGDKNSICLYLFPSINRTPTEDLVLHHDKQRNIIFSNTISHRNKDNIFFDEYLF